jgi:hypothetical protein
MDTITHPVTGEPVAAARCPYCGETFYAPPLHDPIRKHVDYCEKRPEPDDQE